MNGVVYALAVSGSNCMREDLFTTAGGLGQPYRQMERKHLERRSASGMGGQRLYAQCMRWRCRAATCTRWAIHLGGRDTGHFHRQMEREQLDRAWFRNE